MRSRVWARLTLPIPDREKAAIVDSLGGAKADINRLKGLGERPRDDVAFTTMNPYQRASLIRVMPEDVERTAQVFDLPGDNSPDARRTSPSAAASFDLADIS